MESRDSEIPHLPFCDPGEEFANVATHGLGAVLSLAGAPLIAWLAFSSGREAWFVASFGIYGATLFLLYLASTLYHWCERPHIKNFLRSIDHAGIFLFFGGSYTPFAAVCLNGDDRFWLFFWFAWGIALAGMAIKLFFFNGAFCVPSVIVYLAMSGLIYLTLDPIFSVLATAGIVPLFWVGIAAYLIGIVFFLWESLPYNHAIWHLFVVGASVCHYFVALQLLWAGA